MEDFFKNSALAYLTGLITFVAGLAIVLFHNLWVWDWRLIVTLFGWNALLKGAWLVIYPGSASKIANKFAKNMKWAVIPWIIMTAIGVFLMIKGY